MTSSCEHRYILPTPDKSVGSEYTTKCLRCGKKQKHHNYHSTNNVWNRKKSS